MSTKAACKRTRFLLSCYEVLPQILCGAAFLHAHDLTRRAARYDLAAGIAGPRADVDDPVALRGHPHIVLDHHDGIAGIDESRSCTISRSTSAGYRPVVGSSSVYGVSPRCARCSSVASLIR